MTMQQKVEHNEYTQISEIQIPPPKFLFTVVKKLYFPAVFTCLFWEKKKKNIYNNYIYI